MNDKKKEFHQRRIQVFLQVSTITISMMAIILGGAYWLDHQLGTYPKGFIAAIVLSYPLVQIAIYKKLKK